VRGKLTTIVPLINDRLEPCLTTQRLIIGLGATGLACARYFTRQALPFAVMDSRENPPGLNELRQLSPNTPVTLGKFDLSIIQKSDLLILSPGVDPHQPLFANKTIIGDIELFARNAKSPIIGITGTNAKGTVTTLISQMIQHAGLKVSTGGNIGKPALDLLTEPTPDFTVLEISSFQLETTLHLPLIAGTILNISPDHLDRHHTINNYQSAKQRIYRKCQTAVYYRDDLLTHPMQQTPSQYSFGLDEPKDNQAFGIRNNHLAFGTQDLMPLKELSLQGKHHWLNALAAWALGQAIKLPYDAMRQTLKTFKGLPHRCEKVATHNDIDWINDSKGTNVGATLAALESMGNSKTKQIVLIAGGISKGADFKALQPAISQYAKDLILIGESAKKLQKTFQSFTHTHLAASLKEAVHLAGSLAKPHDTILLSPACASFDMFQDYHDRGNQFKQLVKEYLTHAH